MNAEKLGLLVLALVGDKDIPKDAKTIIEKAARYNFSIKDDQGNVLVDGNDVRAMIKELSEATSEGIYIGKNVTVDYRGEPKTGEVKVLKFNVDGCGTKYYGEEDLK